MKFLEIDDRTFVHLPYCIGRTNSIFTSPHHAGRISAPPNHLRIGFSHRILKNQRYLSTQSIELTFPLLVRGTRGHVSIPGLGGNQKTLGNTSSFCACSQVRKCRDRRVARRPSRDGRPSTHGMEIWRCGRGRERSNSFSCTATTARRWEIGAML